MAATRTNTSDIVEYSKETGHDVHVLTVNTDLCSNRTFSWNHERLAKTWNNWSHIPFSIDTTGDFQVKVYMMSDPDSVKEEITRFRHFCQGQLVYHFDTASYTVEPNGKPDPIVSIDIVNY